jgi:hypothetical protein
VVARLGAEEGPHLGVVVAWPWSVATLVGGTEAPACGRGHGQ